MKRMVCLIITVALCLASAGCSVAEEETTAPVTVATEAPEGGEDSKAGAEAERNPVTQITAGVYYKNPIIQVDWRNDEKMLQVYDCRMYPMDNGFTRFEVDYKTVAGLQPVVFAHLDDGDNEPDYWYEVEDLTTDEESTLTFMMGTDFLNQTFGPDVHFRDEFGFEQSWVLIYHQEQVFQTTQGNPIGEATQLLVNYEGDVTVYSARMQSLDNGYVRFTVDCKPREDRYISFYNPPEGSRFMCVTQEPTTGQRETLTVDVRAEDVSGVYNFNLNFFNGEAPVGRVYLNAPIADFNELNTDDFMAFIGGNGQLALLYYGVAEEALTGATVTAEDGSAMMLTGSSLSKNGDGHTLMWITVCTARTGDTISLTVSKEGYEDICLTLYVY